MSTIATHAEAARRWPAVVARAERALAAFANDPKRLACRHVLDGIAVASLCAEHVGGGLRCPRCAVRHNDRHTEATETRCDECQTSGRLIHPLTSLGQVLDLEVRDTKGRRRRIALVLAVGCLGVCPACWAAAGMPAA